MENVNKHISIKNKLVKMLELLDSSTIDDKHKNEIFVLIGKLTDDLVFIKSRFDLIIQLNDEDIKKSQGNNERFHSIFEKIDNVLNGE